MNRQHPTYQRALQWTKLISITGAAQIIVQAVGFISGILVIRLLPVQEYALYTLANTMLGTMTLLSDGGISTGVMAQGGKVWQDRERLGAVLATGLDLRRKFAVWSLLVSTPILFYLLLHNNASWLTATLIVLALIPAFYAALSDTLLEIVPKLHQAILPLQRNGVNVGLVRLLLTTITLFVFPWSFIAILANGIPRIYGNIKLRKISEGFVDKEQKPDVIVKDSILKIVKKSLPTLIFYSLSGQITVWIISIFGNTTSIAQIGALGRIAVLFSLFNVILGTLVIPRFSRSENNKTILLKRYTQILSITVVVMSLLLLGIYFFSDQILWILGTDYSLLNFELMLNMISATLNVISGIAFSLYNCKGWVIHPFYTILKTILILIISSFVFNLSTLVGVLYMNIFFSIAAILIDVSFGYFKIFKLKNL